MKGDVLYSGGAAQGDVVNGNEGDDEENDSEFADIDALIDELEDEASDAV